MRVMVMIKGAEEVEVGAPPGGRSAAAMAAFGDELVRAGVMLDGEGLQPSSTGVRVRYSGGARSVTSGPFSGSKEVVAGYWLWQVRSMDEAIEWARRCPNPTTDDSEIEIRPVIESDGSRAGPATETLEGTIRLQ